VAQLGARFHGMEEVVGSIPTRSTNHLNNLKEFRRSSGDAAISWSSVSRFEEGAGWTSRQVTILKTSSLSIRVITAPYFLATKMEA
jgi:hypothetical protein